MVSPRKPPRCPECGGSMIKLPDYASDVDTSTWQCEHCEKQIEH